jgi:hypothetical protein
VSWRSQIKLGNNRRWSLELESLDDPDHAAQCSISAIRSLTAASHPTTSSRGGVEN